jgi:hypothetical protein
VITGSNSCDASAVVGDSEDRFLVAGDEQSIFEKHLRRIDKDNKTGKIDSFSVFNI